ncbi:MAG: septum formation initiator family protein [Rickettsiales bacterium]|nr:septum formation initiator family protein [Rickettsiales bacterium]
MSRAATFYDMHRVVSKRAIGPLFCVLVLFYLGFHAISGERGLLALFEENRRLTALKAELVDVTTKRQAFESKTKLLSNDSLDLDLLDEQARLVLGLVGKDEVVVFLDDAK